MIFFGGTYSCCSYEMILYQVLEHETADHADCNALFPAEAD